MEGAAGTRHLPRQRPPPRQDCLPLPRPGQPVCQHGARTGLHFTHSRQCLCRSGPRDDAHPGAHAHLLHLCGRCRPRCRQAGGKRPDADGDYPARHADAGHGHAAAAARLRLHARHGHGPLVGRVCSADRGRHHALCAGAGGIGRTRRRDDQGGPGRQWLDGRRHGPVPGRRRNAQAGGWLCSGRQHQFQ